MLVDAVAPFASHADSKDPRDALSAARDFPPSTPSVNIRQLTTKAGLLFKVAP